MPSVFPQALGAPQAPTMPQQQQAGMPDMFAPWVDPNAAQIDALQARIDAPKEPTFTPEQAQQNKADNAQQYALGILGQLSGNQDLGNVGGTVFKQALQNRQPRYTDHGTYDPLTGEFNYSPDYIDERNYRAMDTLQQRSAAQQNNYVMNQQRLAEKLQQERETRASSERNAALIAGGLGLGSGQPMQIGSSPQGWPVFRDKQGRLLTYSTAGDTVPYQGPVAPKETNGAPTEDQNKAAAWFAQASKASADMQHALTLDPNAASPGLLENAVSVFPRASGAVNGVRSPGRQMFMQGASSFAEAVLRAATGAGVNEQEAAQKIAELTPGALDSPELKSQKLASQPMYLASLKQRAGKALAPPSTGGPQPGQRATGLPPAAPASAAHDPYGLLGGQ